MASLSPHPSSLTTPSTPLPKQLCPKLPNQISLSRPKKLPRRPVIRPCKATQQDDPTQPKPDSPVIIDRRNMLLGLGGFYGAAVSLTGNPGLSLAEPVAPNVSKCRLTASPSDGSVGDYCCPPKIDLKKVVDFDFKNYPNPLTKIRRPAHEAAKDPEYVKDYNRAIGLMRSLPLSDPRSLFQQAKVHCAYCDGSYFQKGHSNVRLEVHDSWIFAPFHRWYLYFFERILAKLINKPDFALPYWNWDHPDGMFMPELFKNPDSALFDPNRNADHLSTMMDLTYDGKTVKGPITNEELKVQNLRHMYVQMVNPKLPAMFFGKSYPAGGKPQGSGYLEKSPHNNIHIWVGDPGVRGNQDMGAFWSAGRDPLFYCHHANVDRMWTVWKNLKRGKRNDIQEKDYLDSWFIFYDEHANPIRVYVRDSLDNEKLGYKYKESELLWLNYPPPKPAKGKTKRSIRQAPPAEHVTFPKKLDKVIRTLVARPKKGRTEKEKEETEEVVTIEVELDHSDEFIKFDVYLNDEHDHHPTERTKANTTQYAGSFTMLPHRGDEKADVQVGQAKMKRTIQLALDAVIDALGANDDDELEIVIVPKSGKNAVTITDVKVEIVSE